MTTRNKIIVIANSYQLLKKKGEGSFGKVFIAKPINTNDNEDEKTNSERLIENDFLEQEPFALKLMNKRHINIFENEVSIYKKLKGVKNIPSLYNYGLDGEIYYIGMELLEDTIEDLRRNYSDQMTLNTVLHIGKKMLSIINDIHNKGIIHRDLKPCNFLLKKNTENINEIYLIDFGLSHSFLDEKQRHCILNTNETIVGSHRYMSINSHNGFTLSRRDDLESIGYILMFLYYGKIPWQNQESVSSILKIKEDFGWKNEIIGEFVLFITYCRNLGFTDKPNYKYLHNMISNLMILSE